MLQTLERTTTYETRMLTPADLEALQALCGQQGLPLLPPHGLGPALYNGQLLGDLTQSGELRAALALLPLYSDAVLPASLRAAGYGADGQGAVLTPPLCAGHYPRLRQFLSAALRLAATRYASYHVWAVQPLDAEALPACEDLCAQYLSAGLTLRAVRPMAETQMMVFSARGLPHWREPRRRVHLNDPALPRLLEHGYAVGDFGWGPGGMELLLRDAQ
ncbi:MAG: hypothetical protein DBX91_05715 [Subdoligranulum variabile]|nr:MAG: hypothetical protein DBX91_05715 [Subdoligranulum variabile]